MFKYNNGNIPKALSELFTLNSSNHSYDTRNKDKIRSAYGNINSCIGILDLLVFTSGIIWPATLILIHLFLISKTNKKYLSCLKTLIYSSNTTFPHILSPID